MNRKFSADKCESKERNLEAQMREEVNKVKQNLKEKLRQKTGVVCGGVDDTGAWLSTERHCLHWAFQIFLEHFLVVNSNWELLAFSEKRPRILVHN